MSDFTIEQLESLKEDAPAVLHRYSVDFRGERSHSVKAESGMVRAHTGYGPDGGTAYKDAELFASAPALVDALIAEKRAHQRLRAEIEWFRGSCIESAESLELNAMTAYSPEACESASTVERDTAAALTRILEATDE